MGNRQSRANKLARKAKPKLKLHKSVPLVRLDLACGQTPQEGFEGVDLYSEQAKHKVDLLKFPWPWADNSVDEVFCSHFIEHIPAREVEMRDLRKCNGSAEAGGIDGLNEDVTRFLGQDMFFAFFDELWRVMKNESFATIICPTARSSRGFQDPTHRRFIMCETFAYLWKDWRFVNNLDHYNVRCNLLSEVNFIVDKEMNLLNDEAKTRRFKESWNVIHDWHAKMKVIK